MNKKLSIVAISDTHSYHEHVRFPPCDILIHAGDFSNDIGQKEFRNFLIWLERQPAKHKVLIAGNHDFQMEKWPDLAQAAIKEHAPSVIYLQDSGCEIEGIKLWGSPQTPRFFDWAFNRDRGADIKRYWDMIPNDTDILITHGPAYGILDIAGGADRRHCGCKDLLDKIKEIQPKYHIGGHIHHSFGTKQIFWDMDFTKKESLRKKTTFVNCSICDEAYKPTRHPFIIEYDTKI